MKRAVYAAVNISLPLSGLLWLSGAVPIHLAIGAMILFVFISLCAGLLLLRAANASDMPAPVAWVLGLFATAIAVYALAAGFEMVAAAAFAIWAFLLAAAGLFLAKGTALARHFQPREQAALLLCGLATVMWCRDLAEVPQFLSRENLLTTWTDQFIHGSIISQFGDPRAVGREAIQLADVPIPLYHYASYLPPAVFAWPLDLPGLTLATSIWVPLGFFTLCAATYALGNALAGSAGGVAALLALTLLPDAASYGLHNRLFGYYWYVLAVPGASYGVAVCLLAIVFLQRWSQTRSLRPLFASACLIAGSILIRLHVFALALPAWVISAAISTAVVRRRRLTFFAAAAGAFALFVWSFYAALPDSEHALKQFLDVLHNQQLPISYAGLYQRLLEIYGPGIAVPVGVLIILPASLGVFCVLYPVSVWLTHRSRGLEAIDFVPVVFLICYFLLMITAPVPAYGDATELTHRPFVAFYAVIAAWTAARLAGWVETQGRWRERRIWLPVLLLTAVSVMLALRYTVKDWRWAYTYKVAEGLPQAALFLRSNWHPGDVLATQGLKPGLVTTDLAIQLVSLTGIPAYVTLPQLQGTRGSRYKEVAMDRYSALSDVAHEETALAALARLHELGIRWYVVAQADRRGPRWDPERRHAAFVDGMVAVYSTK
jgi:hypothetical protein